MSEPSAMLVNEPKSAFRLLIVSPTPTHPTSAGNRARIGSLVTALAACGCEVHFAHIERETGDVQAMRAQWGERYHPIPYRQTRHEIGLVARAVRKVARKARLERAYRWRIDDWYDRGCDAALVSLQHRHRFDAVMVEYVFFSRALENFNDGVLKLIDTHDVFGNRHRLYLQNGRTPQWFSTSVEDEVRGLRRADIIVAIQDAERRLFARLTGKRAVTVGHTVRVIDAPRCFAAQLTDLLFVGSDNQINVDGLLWFLDAVLPLIRAQRPDVRLLVAGGVGERIAPRDDIVNLGRFDLPEQVYVDNTVVINPVRYGTGLNIKSIEALGLGMPLVATIAGARGLEAAAGSALLCADEPPTFARAVLDVLNDPAKSRRLSEAAVEFARDWNVQQIEQLSALLNVAPKDLRATRSSDMHESRVP